MTFVLSCDKNEDGTYSVTFDNDETLLFSGDEVAEYWLYDTDKGIEDFEDLCVRFLSRRMVLLVMPYVVMSKKTARMVKDRIFDKIQLDKDGYLLSVCALACDTAIEYLKTNGYIDDLGYARKYTARAIDTHTSRNALKMDLSSKGIDDSIIYTVLDEYDIDDHSNAMYLAYKKLSCERHDITQKQIAKVCRFLQGKGFDLDCSVRAAKEAAEKISGDRNE